MTQRKTTLDSRIAILDKFLTLFEAEKEDVGKEITEEMGRPIRYSAGEVGGFLERAKYMVSIAKTALAEVSLKDSDKPGFKRYIRKDPLGVVFIILPWNVSFSNLYFGISERCLCSSLVGGRRPPSTSYG